MLGAPQPKQLCFYLLEQHSLALLPFPEVPILGFGSPQTFLCCLLSYLEEQPLLSCTPGLCVSLHISYSLCNANMPLVNSLPSFLDTSKPSPNSREHPAGPSASFPEQPAEPYLVQLTPGAGNAAQLPPPAAACPVCAIVPLCAARVPHCATTKQEGPSLCWIRSLCPLHLLEPGIKRACAPASLSAP